ncbi:uncharacterized protein LOC112569437 isoform X2 [Pomacea canaliculata]|uniref:uncharacterized protein LOC112569437 isoform X2 n=1 Tax=Pomacea canaliculata TaxID=400727 RepID=UPI000D731D57|nr:uncharacterized protein LOC112569437 isoform X2 [Pomacea canaliculata]
MILLYIGTFVVAVMHFTLSQDALTLQLHNYQNPFIVDEGVASEIIFSILGADDLTNYSLALAQETAASFYTRCSLNVSSVHCWEVKRDDCQCANLGQGQRRFKLTVTFEASHVGQWMFAVWSHNVTPVFFNVTFVEQSTEEIHTTSNVLHHTTAFGPRDLKYGRARA